MLVTDIGDKTELLPVIDSKTADRITYPIENSFEFIFLFAYTTGIVDLIVIIIDGPSRGPS